MFNKLLLASNTLMFVMHCYTLFTLILLAFKGSIFATVYLLLGAMHFSAFIFLFGNNGNKVKFKQFFIIILFWPLTTHWIIMSMYLRFQLYLLERKD